MQGKLRNLPPVKPTLWLSIVALGLLLLLAACGSSNGTASSTTAASSGASTAATSTPATSNAASTSAQASDTSGGNDYGGGGYGKYGNTGAATPAPKPTTAPTPVTSAATPTPIPPTPTPAVGGATKAVTITTTNGMFGFSPTSLTISVGTTVIWTNMTGAPHTVTSDDGKTFDSGVNTPIGQGATFSFKFTKPGKYSYHCQFHPYMVATIIVQ